MKEPLFYLCSHCGNLITKLVDSGSPPVCCGDPMNELKPNTSDGAIEKHVPVFTRAGDTFSVQVGSAPHPMLEEHHIGFVWLHIKNGGQVKYPAIGGEPKAQFTLAPGDEARTVYAWCNLHGLWKADI